MLNGLDLANQRITSLADGSGATDAVTKQQLDNAVAGLSWKAPVRAATTANITLTGTQTVDGVSLVANDRVLVKNQTTTSANGIYIVAAGAWSRATDADAAGELVNATVYVSEGTTQADQAFTQTANAPITVGTTGLSFAQVGGGTSYSAGNGLTLTGSSFSVNPAASGGITVAAGGVSVDTAVVVRKFASSIGNGSLTSLPVANNLGTRDVTVAVFDNTTFEEVFPDVVHTDANTVTCVFATAPAASAYRVVVHG
jgi:hypothetical protein